MEPPKPGTIYILAIVPLPVNIVRGIEPTVSRYLVAIRTPSQSLHLLTRLIIQCSAASLRAKRVMKPWWRFRWLYYKIWSN